MKNLIVTEPAYSLLYSPNALPQIERGLDPSQIGETLKTVQENPFNARQQEAFESSFRNRVSLIWGPPGTGKTSVLAGIIVGWIDAAIKQGRAVRIGVGASNYNAIDNLLIEAINLCERYTEILGLGDLPAKFVRVRGDHSQAPADERIGDILRTSQDGKKLNDELDQPKKSLVIGGTWQQLGKLREKFTDDKKPIAQWFDLFIIDEASQMAVANASAYFLLLDKDANVVFAGDHKQLGPIYGFPMKESNNGLYDCIFEFMRQEHGVAIKALDQNYRTNDQIAGWPKLRFYSEGGYIANFPERRLEIEMPDKKPEDWAEQILWSDEYLRILDPEAPIVVITYEGTGYTLSNPFEAQITSGLALLYRKILIERDGGIDDTQLWNDRLGIVTPHRAQIASIRNTLTNVCGFPTTPPPAVDTVDRFQGLERDLILSSYTVADADFVRQEEDFILNPRRFNVTLTRARRKFIMLISQAIIRHLPADIDVARDASHLQLFVEDYCLDCGVIDLPFIEGGEIRMMSCRLKKCVNERG